MKELFVSFCLAFFLTIAACFFNYFQSMVVSSLGGLFLACMAYWRLTVVGRAGLSIFGHTLAFLLGFVALLAPLFIVMYDDTKGSLMIVASYGLAIVLAGLFYRFRNRMAISAPVLFAVWLAFVIVALPAWSDYIATLK